MGSKLIRVSDLTLEKLNAIRYPEESYNRCLYRLMVSLSVPDVSKTAGVEIIPDWDAVELAHVYKARHEIPWIKLRLPDNSIQERPEVMKNMPEERYSKWYERWKTLGGKV